MVRVDARLGSRHFSFRMPEPTATDYAALVKNTGCSHAMVATKAIQALMTMLFGTPQEITGKAKAMIAWQAFHRSEMHHNIRPPRRLDKKRKRT